MSATPSAAADQIRVLIVDDEPGQIELTKLNLKSYDPTLIVNVVATPTAALDLLRERRWECVVSDYQMPLMDGIELCRKLREFSEVPFIMYTGRGSEEVASAAFSVGVDDYIKKEHELAHFKVLARRIRHTVEKRRLENLYRVSIEENRDGLAILCGTTLVYANKALAKLFGVPERKDLIGRDSLEWIVEEDREMVRGRAIARQRGEEQPTLYRYRIRRPDGQIRTLEASVTATTYHGEPASIAFDRDVTDEKRLEDELASRNKELERQAAMLANANDAIIGYDEGYRVIYWNAMAERLYGYTVAEAMGNIGGELLKPTYLGTTREQLVKQLMETSHAEAESTRQTRDGRKIMVEVRIIQLKDQRGEPIGYVSIDRDITDRKRLEEENANQLEELASANEEMRVSNEQLAHSEEELAISEGRFRSILNNSLDVIYRFNLSTNRYEYMSPASKTVLNFEPEELMAMSNAEVMDRVHPEDKPALMRELSALNEKGVASAVYRFLGKDGRYTWWSKWMVLTRDEEGKPLYRDGFVRDVTSQKNSEEALRISEEKYRSLYTTMIEGLALHELILDPSGEPIDYRIIDVNPAYESILGLRREDVLGKLASELYGTGKAPYLDVYANVASTKMSETFETYFEPMNKHFNVSVFSPGENRFATIFQDITLQKRTEYELKRLLGTLNALSNGNRLLATNPTEEAYLEEVCKIIIRDMDYHLAWIGFAENDERKSVRPVAYAGFDEGYIAQLRITWADEERGRGPTGTAIKTGEVAICKDMLTDPRFEPWRGEALRRGYASSIVYPLKQDGKPFGAISIYSSEPNPWSSEEIGLLQQLADDISLGILSIREREAKKKAEIKLSESVEELAATNEELRASQEELQEYSAMLEERVNARTREIKAVNERLVAFTESAPDAFFIFDGGMRLIDLNRAALAFFPSVQDKNEIIGRHMVELIPGIEDTPRYGGFLGVLEMGKPYHEEDQVSIIRPGRGFASTWAFKVGPNLGIITRDVTEHVNAEEELRQASLYGRSLIEASLDAMVTISPEGKITDVNQATVEVTGVLRDLLIGSDFSSYFTEPEKARDGYQTVFSTGAVRDYPLVIRHTSGRLTHVLYNATVFRDETGRVQGVFAAARDVTEKDRLEEDLRRSNERLYQAEKMAAISRMGAMIAHDLRGPLNIISQSTEAIEKFPHSRERMLGLVKENADRALRMIEDMRQGTKEIEVKEAPTDLGALIKKVVAETKWPEKVKPTLALEGDVTNINLDPDLMRRVIENLISNSLEAIPGWGKVSIRARRDGGDAVVDVSDTGTGIPAEAQGHIWEPFYTTKSKGMGLGLPFTKRAVEAHGGTIAFRSKAGEGTTFTFRIPVKVV